VGAKSCAARLLSSAVVSRDQHMSARQAPQLLLR